MDNTETNKITINPKFDLDKDVIRTWLDIIPKINQSKEQDVEKVLKIIEEKLTIIAISELFSKEVLDENESHFLTSFCPSLIRRISNENVTNSYLKSILRNILNLFTNEFIKNFENVNCFPIWEALVETFREEKLFNRSYDDSSDKFLVIKTNPRS
jgi:hypothetical protein